MLPETLSVPTNNYLAFHESAESNLAARKCCAADHSFPDGQVYHIGIAVRLDPKMVVAMLAEIFMVRSEAKARLVEEVLPSSRSGFIPFSPRTQFVFKETAPKGAEAPSEEPPVGVVR